MRSGSAIEASTALALTERRAVLTPDMQPFDVQQDAFGRVVFVAQKHGGG